MDEARLDDALALCRTLAEWAMAEIAASFGRGAESARHKSDAADWVTDADVRVEAHVRAAIAARFPDHRIRGEEHGEGGAADSPLTWYVDPIDGTCNFANGVPWSAFSIALLDGDTPLAGAVGDPYRRELVSAARGRGVWVNGRRHPGAAAGAPALGAAATVDERVAGRIVTMELANAGHWPGMDPCMRWCEQRLVTVRVMGASALSVTQAALGRAVGCVLGGSNPIDVGAAVLFAREAGLTVLGADGQAEGWPGGGLVAAPAGVAEALWQSAFGAGGG